MLRPAQSYIYHETFRVFRHDTGYGIYTEQIPCLGVGPTPRHAMADLVQRVHRTKLPLVLAYAAMPDEDPIPPDMDYLDGRLSVQVSIQPGRLSLSGASAGPGGQRRGGTRHPTATEYPRTNALPGRPGS
jgi:hypothetical protein